MPDTYSIAAVNLNGVTHPVAILNGHATRTNGHRGRSPGSATLRGREWDSGLPQGHNIIKVTVAEVPVEHQVKVIEFTKWLKRTRCNGQRWKANSGLSGTDDGATCEVHLRFCELLPEDLLWIENPETKERIRVVPGELRRPDVRVGRHVPISPGAMPRFLERFSEVYGRLGKTDSILSAAHRRLVWIHPFLDGNGRVARLLSHAMFLETLDTGGVWSVARGLARSEVGNYKEYLAASDAPRRNDEEFDSVQVIRRHLGDICEGHQHQHAEAHPSFGLRFRRRRQGPHVVMSTVFAIVFNPQHFVLTPRNFDPDSHDSSHHPCSPR